MLKCGWKNADDKMIKCEWENADGKMRMTMWVDKLLTREINNDVDFSLGDSHSKNAVVSSDCWW